jgi:hypothetical protein
MSDVSTTTRSPIETARGHRLVRGTVPYATAAALGLAVAASAGISLVFPSVLAGTEVTKGNLRGTALVLLALGLPVLAVASVKTAKGSARALVVWLGTLGYLLYQAVLFCFGTPVNDLFMFYVAYLGLAVWSIVLLLRALDLGRFGARLSADLPARPIGGVLMTVVTLNALAWLGQIVPALVDGQPGRIVKDTGLLTNPVFVQDLSVWLPLGAIAALACWRRHVWGQLVAAAMLVMLVLESFGVAADQWFGSRADPTSESASLGAVPLFVAMAVLIAIPLAWYLRGIDGEVQQSPAADDRTRVVAGSAERDGAAAR